MEKEEEIIYLEMDDDDEEEEEGGAMGGIDEAVFVEDVSPIPKIAPRKRKSSTVLAPAPPGEKRRALIEGFGMGGAASAAAARPVPQPQSTEWRWSCPDCLREFSGMTLDKKHIEITRPGVLSDCSNKAQYSPSSQTSSPSSFSPSSSSSSSSLAHHRCSVDANNWEVVLLLDSREVRTRSDRTYIYNMLVAKEGVNCEVRALPLGDVTWIVRRKKDAPKPAKVPPHLIRGAGGGGCGGGAGGGRSFLGMAIPSSGGGGGGGGQDTSSSSSSSKLAKKAPKDTEKKALKESEKKAKLLAASSAPRAEEEYLLDFIIERKSCNDLAASIIDGRYNEQKMRLSNSGMRVTYLIEGDPHQVSLGGTGGQRARSGGIPPVKIGAKHILTAMTNTQVFAGFHVVQTTSIDASITHIAAMHRIVEAHFLASLACEREISSTGSTDEVGGGRGRGGGVSPTSIKGRTAGSSSSSSSSAGLLAGGGSMSIGGVGGMRPFKRTECPNDVCSLMGRSTVLQRVKTYATWAEAMKRPRHMTVMTLFGRALRQVSGCSAERAQAILERYPTPASLTAAYKALQYPVRDGPAMLKGLPVRGQKACIGPALSSAVYDAFRGEARRVKKEVVEEEEGDGEEEEEEGEDDDE